MTKKKDEKPVKRERSRKDQKSPETPPKIDTKAKKKPAKKKVVSLKPAAIELPNPPKKKRSAWDRLTLKQKKFVKAYFECDGNATEAARRAGYSPDRAAISATEVVRSRNGQAAFASCLDKAGLTDDFIAARIREGVEAKEIKFFSHEGTVTDERETTDYPTRHTYLATALKAKGLLRNQVDVDLSGAPTAIILSLGALPDPDEEPNADKD